MSGTERIFTSKSEHMRLVAFHPRRNVAAARPSRHRCLKPMSFVMYSLHSHKPPQRAPTFIEWNLLQKKKYFGLPEGLAS